MIRVRIVLWGVVFFLSLGGGFLFISGLFWFYKQIISDDFHTCEVATLSELISTLMVVAVLAWRIVILAHLIGV